MKAKAKRRRRVVYGLHNWKDVWGKFPNISKNGYAEFLNLIIGFNF
jgi:hypothetical protein